MSDQKPVIFTETHSFWWPVTVRLPDDEGGIEHTFEARIRLIPDSELIPDIEDDGDIQGGIERDRTFLRDNVEDLRGISHPTLSGKDLLEAMIQFMPYRLALVWAIQAAHRGQGARLGN